ncbi:MAG: hypothetical protein AB8H47_06610 [Bacteroidia bacterium]
MSKNQNRLINTQRTSVINKLLKGIGGALLLSMLIFGALSVQNEETLEASNAKTETLASESLAEKSSTQAQQESFSELAMTETESVESTESVEEVEAVESAASTSSATSSQAQTSTKAKARVASVKGTAGIASTASAVKFMAVESSLNATGTAGLVKWSTAMEQNSKFFEIERSLDGDNFESLGKINAQGKGAHSQRNDYSFEDESLGMTQMPRVFYRVKQIGLDGKSVTTDMVEHDLNLDLGLYAAILKGESSNKKIKIRYAGDQEGAMVLRIFKPSGEVLIEQTLKSDFKPQMVSVETAGWEAGPYFLQLVNDNTTVMEQFSL